MQRLPTNLEPYRKTALFDETSVPDALLEDHATKEGVWGVITVLSGELQFVAPSLGLDVVLNPARPGVVKPTVPHRVKPLGPVSFYVEFWRSQRSGRAPKARLISTSCRG